MLLIWFNMPKIFHTFQPWGSGTSSTMPTNTYWSMLTIVGHLLQGHNYVEEYQSDTYAKLQNSQPANSSDNPYSIRELVCLMWDYTSIYTMGTGLVCNMNIDTSLTINADQRSMHVPQHGRLHVDGIRAQYRDWIRLKQTNTWCSIYNYKMVQISSDKICGIPTEVMRICSWNSEDNWIVSRNK